MTPCTAQTCNLGADPGNYDSFFIDQRENVMLLIVILSNKKVRWRVQLGLIQMDVIKYPDQISIIVK